MRNHSQSYKRLKCEICKSGTLTSIAKVSEDEYALALPPDWRLLWGTADKTLQFWCGECWKTFALTLDQDENPDGV
jgi:hypothetical protein